MSELVPASPFDGRLASAVGARVKELREERGLSQRELARHLQVSDSTIAKYEAGVHAPPVAVLVRLAATFDISLDRLVGRVGGPSPLRDPRLIRCMREIAMMDERSQELVTIALEGLVKAYRTLQEISRTAHGASASEASR